MAQAQQASNKEVAETILVRHPLPKYSFQGKKLPKDYPKNLQPSTSSNSNSSLSTTTTTTSAGSQPLPVLPTMPVKAISSSSSSSIGGAGIRQNSSDTSLDRKSAAVKPFSASGGIRPQPASVPGLTLSSKPMAAVVASNVRSCSDAGGRESSSREAAEASGSAAARAGEGGTKGKELMMSYLPSAPLTSAETVDIPVPDAALLAHAVEGPSTEEKLQKAEREISMLRSQLDVQLQVNSEIKRLLVASVGDDFERKVENLARDRAQLAMELGDFTRKMTEDYENLDQISIQADMWRSKYLASRVMVEELASARAWYSAQFQDSQNSLQQLLNERYELRTGLLHSYKILQQVKEAFDPLNSQRSPSLGSTSVLDLTAHIKQLSEAVRFRLLPAHAGSHVIMPLDQSWESTMTHAELTAYQQLSKQSAPPSFKHSMPSCSSLTSSSAASSSASVNKSFERFHPLVRHDNLTINCCTHCKGEIQLA